MTILLSLRAAPSGPLFEGENEGDTLLWSVAERKFYVGPGSGGGAVSSVFGRTGAVVAEAGDYNSDQVDNESSVSGDTVSDALDTLQAEIVALGSPLKTAFLSLVNTDMPFDYVSDDVFGILQSVAGDFLLAQDAAEWAIGDNGVLTYTGPDCVALISCAVWVSTSGYRSFAAAVAKNGDLIGKALFSPETNAASFQASRTPGPFSWQSAFTANRRVTLTSGDTLQVVGALTLDVGTPGVETEGLGMTILTIRS